MSELPDVELKVFKDATTVVLAAVRNIEGTRASFDTGKMAQLAPFGFGTMVEHARDTGPFAADDFISVSFMEIMSSNCCS